MEVMAPIPTFFHDPVGVIGARCPNIAVVDEQDVVTGYPEKILQAGVLGVEGCKAAGEEACPSRAKRKTDISQRSAALFILF